jgi:hypothetical protein
VNRNGNTQKNFAKDNWRINIVVQGESKLKKWVLKSNQTVLPKGIGNKPNRGLPVTLPRGVTGKVENIPSNVGSTKTNCGFPHAKSDTQNMLLKTTKTLRGIPRQKTQALQPD